MNLSDYEIIIRPKPITEFDSIEDLQRWLERQKQPESAQEIRRREQREREIVNVLSRYPDRLKAC